MDTAGGEIDVLQFYRCDGTVPCSRQEGKIYEGTISSFDLRAIGHPGDDLLDLFDVTCCRLIRSLTGLGSVMIY